MENPNLWAESPANSPTGKRDINSKARVQGLFFLASNRNLTPMRTGLQDDMTISEGLQSSLRTRLLEWASRRVLLNNKHDVKFVCS